MRKYALAVVLISLVAFTGCGERRRVSSETHAMSNVYTVKMKKGETTREQDQKYIEAMNDVVYELDRSIRGKKKADETKRLSTALGNGTDPREVLNLK